MSTHDPVREALAELVARTEEIISLCAAGDVDESTEALGWGAAILATKQAVEAAERALSVQHGMTVNTNKPAPVAEHASEPVETVPWPTVTRYSGGASHEGIGGRVWIRLSDDGPEVEYVPASAPSGDSGQLPAPADQMHAAIAAERAKADELRTVMVAAAEEIHAHWDAHCDAEGYGPQNLMRRLEEGIPSEYGYTAGRFAELQAERSTLREQLAEAVALCKRMHDTFVDDVDFSAWPGMLAAQRECMEAYAALAAKGDGAPNASLSGGRRPSARSASYAAPGESAALLENTDEDGKGQRGRPADGDGLGEHAGHVGA